MIGNFENSRGHLEAYTAFVSHDPIISILGLITMPLVINVEPVFLIRFYIPHISRSLMAVLQFYSDWVRSDVSLQVSRTEKQRMGPSSEQSTVVKNFHKASPSVSTGAYPPTTNKFLFGCS